MRHGVLLTGGGDVQPARYGARPTPRPAASTPCGTPSRSGCSTPSTIDLPLLATCRGMQVLNVAMGGSLVQHVPPVTGQEHDQIDRWREPSTR